MRKIRLKVETLAVESFQTHAAAIDAGTVQGHQDVSFAEKCIATAVASCPRANTHEWSCDVPCECTHADIDCS